MTEDSARIKEWMEQASDIVLEDGRRMSEIFEEHLLDAEQRGFEKGIKAYKLVMEIDKDVEIIISRPPVLMADIEASLPPTEEKHKCDCGDKWDAICIIGVYACFFGWLAWVFR